MSFNIGIDVGGTFTDIVVADGDGRAVTAKAGTTPHDQSIGVMEGVALAAEAIGLAAGELLSRTGRIVHGTTVATNALLEGKGARTGMLITAGHRDVIEMREGLKPERYNLRMPPPEPLVPRWLRLGVRERLRADGSVETPLDPASLEAAVDTLSEAQVEAVAICFLHSWRNPAHEQQASEAVRRRLPGVYVAVSSEVLPEIKEFERFSAAVANAAVGPVIEGYLARLNERLREAGFGGDLFVILSHGGVASVAEACRLAVATALSGPAGGVAAAVALARQGVGEDLITFDMGGTSTDIAVIRDGQPSLSPGRLLAGTRIALPALDIVTLGAGGGSIAYLDPSGLLQVGPGSAGADPGPACYGRGGQEPTVTDADLGLGYLDPAAFLGGRRRLDREAGEAAVGRLAAGLGLTPVAAAAGIHRVIDMRMADAVRVATVRRGVDPRRHAILAFGGAAGLHVCAVAAELGISRVIVPMAAPVLSAWGMLTTDLRVELSQSMPQSGGIDVAALKAAFAEMEAEGRSRLGWFEGPIEVRRSADMRYGEQVFEVSVGLDGLAWDEVRVVREIEVRFQRRHEALYTYSLPDQEVVLVNARMAVIGQLPDVSATGVRDRPEAAPHGHRRIYLADWVEVPVFDFERLGSGQRIAGPAAIESEATTVLVRPGDAARFDSRGWVEITIGK
jgi:N-methylhydantoinase A